MLYDALSEWHTFEPPLGIGNVFVALGNGDISIQNADDLREKYRGFCWIAWCL